MKLNYIPLFMSFWFSTFFLSMALFNSFIPLEELDTLTNILAATLFITTSRETAKFITIFLLEEF